MQPYTLRENLSITVCRGKLAQQTPRQDRIWGTEEDSGLNNMMVPLVKVNYSIARQAGYTNLAKVYRHSPQVPVV